MSAGNRMTWQEGADVALDVMALLADCTTRIAIAGSIRRGKADVGDVEIVAAPRFEQGINLLHERLDALARGVMQKRLKANGDLLSWGTRYRALAMNGVAVDVFVVLPDRDWGLTLLIRTGPGEANESLVTTAGVKTRNGVRGILPKGMRFENGGLWADGNLLHCPEEWDVFAAVGLPFVDPPGRTPEAYQQAARMQSSKTPALPPRPGVDVVWDPDGRTRKPDVESRLATRLDLAQVVVALQSMGVQERLL